MRVRELWRFPVKSLQGERVQEAMVTPSGIEGDRRYALFDARTGIGLTARRLPEMLFASAALGADGSVQITLADGSVAEGNEALSDWLGRRVELRASSYAGARSYENIVDLENEESSSWRVFDGPPGPFHDSRSTRVSLVSTATLGTWDRRRFRSNVVLEGAGEDALVGSKVGIGEAVLDVGKRISRCVMVTRPQPGGIDRDLEVFRTISRRRDSCLAVGALVSRPGIVRVGDEIDLRAAL